MQIVRLNQKYFLKLVFLKMLSDEEILDIYKDEKFPGSFSGLRTFQQFLLTDKNEHISIKRLRDILKTQIFFITSQRQIKKFPRRHYYVQSFGEIFQADLAEMYECEGFHFFLLVIDVFSNHMWTVPLKNKAKETVKLGFQLIFDEIGNLPTKISTDQGKEFISLKSFFAEKGILLTLKTGKNKANFSEYGIYLVKKRLFMLLRSKLSKNWPKYLQDITNALNQRHLSRIGNLQPQSVNSFLDDVKVQEALKTKPSDLPPEPSWQEQEKNTQNYESSSNPFKIGSYVFLDEKQSVFNKSFHIQVILPSIYLVFKVKKNQANKNAKYHFLKLVFERSYLVFKVSKNRTRSRL